MNRRTLLKGVPALTVGALLLPSTVIEIAERRFWALGGIPVTPEPGVWLSGRFDTSAAWRIVPIGARAYWHDGRITEEALTVLPGDVWRVDVPRQAFRDDNDGFSLAVCYHTLGDPDHSAMTTHTQHFGSLAV